MERSLRLGQTRSTGSRNVKRRVRQSRVGRGGRGGASRAGLYALVGVMVVGGLVAASLGASRGTVTDLGIETALVYSAGTSTEAAISIPDSVKESLRGVGLKGGAVSLTRVEADGSVTHNLRDLTPRVDDKPDSPVLKVPERALAAVNEKLAELEEEMNSVEASEGNRSLFLGLSKMTFEGDVYVFSSGLDLNDPVDFRKLAFDVPPEQVVERLVEAGELPDLTGVDITFVIIPTAGVQEQLRRPQRDYVEEVWAALFTAAGASSVEFIDTVGGPTSATTDTPVVPLPGLPGTPIAPEPAPEDPAEQICELDTSTYFKPNKPVLLDEKATKADLRDCVGQIGENTTISLDGWTAYFGPLDAQGVPVTNPQFSIDLSRQRAEAIRDLLINEMGVPASSIVHVEGHGSANQPNPQDPGSALNRTVQITITTSKGEMK